MKIGTKSLLVGVHQVFIHPVVVYKAWRILYGKPTLRELICIVVHDWGYFGKKNMDGDEGEKHPELGAKIVGKLFGQKYYELCLCHSRTYAKELGLEPSALCWADKLSLTQESKKFYLFRAKLTGELQEFRSKKSGSTEEGANLTDSDWFDFITARMKLIAEAKKDILNDCI